MYLKTKRGKQSLLKAWNACAENATLVEEIGQGRLNVTLVEETL